MVPEGLVNRYWDLRSVAVPGEHLVTQNWAWDEFGSPLESSWDMNLCLQLLLSSFVATLTVLVLLWNCVGAPRQHPRVSLRTGHWFLIFTFSGHLSHSKIKKFHLHNRKQKSNFVDSDQCALLAPQIALDDVVILSHFRNSPACKLLRAS